MLLRFSLVPLCLLSSVAVAHGDMAPESKHAIDASASLSWRSAGTVDKDVVWRIPGIQMGGEAMPVEEGLVLDDAQISGRFSIAENTRVYATLMQHAGHDEVALEHLWFSQTFDHGSAQLAAGKMMAEFSPAAAWHSSSAQFSEAPLIGDLFWGRHFMDTGLRAQWGETVQLGAEVWQGDNFPATAGQDGGSADVFAKTQFAFGHWQHRLGIWAMLAQADLRPDQRYLEDGHSHGGVTVLPEDIRFSGDSTLSGAWWQSDWHINHDWQFGAYLEFVDSQLDGDIRDDVSLADLQGDYQGWLSDLHLQFHQHRLTLRYEGAALDNAVTGPAAATLADDAGLLKSEDPERFTVQWHWQFMPTLALRVEGIRDNTMRDASINIDDESNDRVVIGLQWQQVLWQQ